MMLENLQIPQSTMRHCKIGAIAETLDAKDKTILLEAIANPAWAIKTLSRELAKLGIHLSDTPLTNHRKQTCACFRA
jgi:hypothetical protein